MSNKTPLGRARVVGDESGVHARAPGGSALKPHEAVADEAQSAECLRVFIEAVNDYAIFFLGPEGRIVSWNAGARALKGYAANEIIGRHFSVFYTTEDREGGVPDHALHVAAEEGRFEEEGWRARKDGSLFWASVAITALRNESHDLVGFAKVTRDFSERRAIEESRSRASDHLMRLSSVDAALSEAIDLVEVAEVIIDACLEAVGAASASVALAVEDGRELELVTEMGRGPAEVEEWAAFVRAAGSSVSIVGGRERCPIDARIPLCNVVRSRSPLWLRDPAEVQARLPEFAPLFTSCGHRAMACLPLIARGVTIGALRLSFTEDRSFDSEERMFLHSLAHQCALAVDRAQLYGEAVAARVLAERATNMRDEFLAIVAHDLGNPINIVGLWARIILDGAPSGPEGETARSGAGNIRDAARQMNMLLHDLRDVASLDAGHLAIRKQEGDVETLVTETVDSLAPLCLAQELSISGTAPSLRLSCDPNRVQQVLGNLVANAIKFTPKGGRISVEAVACGQEIRFSVADTGTGIPEQARARVFERYWQGKARTSTASVGLGLFISKGLVDAHGGRIWVESAVGGGSMFCFTIPLA